MSDKPKEPTMDFKDEIAQCEAKLEARFPLLTSYIEFKVLKRLIRSEETNLWFNRIAGINSTGGTGTTGGSVLEIAK